MSTVPHNPTDSAHSEGQAAIPPSFRVDLDEAVRRFEAAAENLGVERPSSVELRRLCDQVMSFTAELFPGAMDVEVRVDPEIADDLYFVFEVLAAGSADEIVERDAEWHRRLVGVARRWPGMFRLSVDAR